MHAVFYQNQTGVIVKGCAFLTLKHYWDTSITVDVPDMIYTLQWRHNDLDDVLNHQPYGCLLNRLFRRRSKKTSKLRVTGLCAGSSPGPVNSSHKGPVTWKMFPYDDVIMRHCRNYLVHIGYVPRIHSNLEIIAKIVPYSPCKQLAVFHQSTCLDEYMLTNSVSFYPPDSMVVRLQMHDAWRAPTVDAKLPQALLLHYKYLL